MFLVEFHLTWGMWQQLTEFTSHEQWPNDKSDKSRTCNNRVAHVPHLSRCVCNTCWCRSNFMHFLWTCTHFVWVVCCVMLLLFVACLRALDSIRWVLHGPTCSWTSPIPIPSPMPMPMPSPLHKFCVPQQRLSKYREWFSAIVPLDKQLQAACCTLSVARLLISCICAVAQLQHAATASTLATSASASASTAASTAASTSAESTTLAKMHN